MEQSNSLVDTRGNWYTPLRKSFASTIETLITVKSKRLLKSKPLWREIKYSYMLFNPTENVLIVDEIDPLP